jgi:hypothetical protein
MQKIIQQKGDIECLSSEDDIFFELRDAEMVKWDDDDELYYVLPKGYEWLKSYIAKCVTDAPEPLPVVSFYGATPIPVEEGWREEVQQLTTERDAALVLAEGIADQYQQQIKMLKDSVALKSATIEAMTELVDAARTAQEQLRDAVVAVTAERDALVAAIRATCTSLGVRESDDYPGLISLDDGKNCIHLRMAQSDALRELLKLLPTCE